MKFFGKEVKRLDFLDMGLIKLSVVAFVLWILSVWSSAREFLNLVNSWYFFIAFLILALRPALKMFR